MKIVVNNSLVFCVLFFFGYVSICSCFFWLGFFLRQYHPLTYLVFILQTDYELFVVALASELRSEIVWCVLQPLDCFTCFIGKTTRKKVKEIQNNQEQKPESKRFFKKGVVGYATRSRFTFFCLFGEKCQYIFFIFLNCDIHRIAAVKKKLDYNNITGVYMFRRLSCRFYVGYFD